MPYIDQYLNNFNNSQQITIRVITNLSFCLAWLFSDLVTRVKASGDLLQQDFLTWQMPLMTTIQPCENFKDNSQQN